MVAAIVVISCFALAVTQTALAQDEEDLSFYGCGKKCKKMTQEQLDEILEKHKLWLETNEKQGERARFLNVKFKGAQLGATKLMRAVFTNCDFHEANFRNADLREANVLSTDLHKASFIGADLHAAKFHNVDLHEANFHSADLHKARFIGGNLYIAYFQNADLREADFFSANLHAANFFDANMHKASFTGGDLHKAVFLGADLRQTIFRGSDLRKVILGKGNIKTTSIQGAVFGGVKLKGAIFFDADFENVSYEPEPGQLPKVEIFSNAKNLFKITYKDSPHGLVELRNAFKKYGMRQQKREMTYAIKHNERIKESGWLWGGVQLIFFEFPVGWGLYPERALFIMAGLVPFFAVLYYFPLGLGTWRGGTIWMRWRKKRATNLSEPDHPRPLKRRGCRRVAFALYFSLLSAFHIGWRDLNVGTWITRMQPREYTLQATGWTRVVSGVQSLISVYLLALAVLSYFGRPFE